MRRNLILEALGGWEEKNKCSEQRDTPLQQETRQGTRGITGSMVLAQKANSNELAFKLDKDGKILEANAKAVEALGLEKAEDVIGKDFVGDLM